MHSGLPTLFGGHWDIGAYRLLEEGIVHGWWCKGDGPNHSLTKLDGGSPSNAGSTNSPVKGDLGRELTAP